jgi:hypothetical protein
MAEGKDFALTMYKLYSLKNTMNKPNEWCAFTFLFMIPEKRAEKLELSACMCNNKGYLFRNVKCSLY